MPTLSIPLSLKRTLALGALLALAVLAFGIAQARAITHNFDVNLNATDASQGGPVDGNCHAPAAIPANACTLRAAIELANAVPGGDSTTITVAQDGTPYLLTLGALHVTRSVTIVGKGASTSLIDGNGASRVFDIGGAATVALSRVTIQGGHTAGGGGAIRNTGSLTLTDVTVKSNKAEFGAGISNAGILTINRGFVKDNTADDAGGGIATFPAPRSPFGSVTINGTAISSNAAELGGGIADFGPLTITNAHILSNTALAGGGIAAARFRDFSGNAAVTSSTISKNTALMGAGAFIFDRSAAAFTATTLDHNQAAGDSDLPAIGGGIFNLVAGITLVNDTLNANAAANFGGGIAQIGFIQDRREVAVANGVGSMVSSVRTVISTIAKLSELEQTDQDVISGAATGTVNFVTIDGNTAASERINGGGGVFNAGNASSFGIHNTIVADNIGKNCATAASAVITSADFNLDSANDCSFSASHDLTNKNPNVQPLNLNAPGTTATMALVSGSPAVDNADPVGCVATDERGVTRPQGPACDIGAYELQVTPPSNPPPTAVPSPPVTGQGLGDKGGSGLLLLALVLPLLAISALGAFLIKRSRDA